MAHLIDKEPIVAKIKERRSKNARNKFNLAAAFEDNYLLSFIDTLEVKEPASEDLEQASRKYADDEEYGDNVYFSIKAAFKVGAQWQRERMKETLQMEYEKGRYDMREELMHDDKFLKAIGHTYVEWIDAGINTNDVDPADYIREHLFD